MSRAVWDWIKFWLAALFMPVSILVVGSLYMNSLQTKNRLDSFSSEGFEALETMRYVSDTEQYLCNSINEIFIKYDQPWQIKQNFEKFVEQNRISCRFFVWQADGKVAFSNFDMATLSGNLAQAFSALNKIRETPGQSGIISTDEEENLRSIFGRHFFPAFFSNCFSGRFRELLRTDAAKKKPLTWMNVTEKAGLCVLFDYDILESDCGLKTFIRNNQKNLVPGYIDGDRVFCSDSELQTLMQNRLQELKIGFSEMLEISDFRVLLNYVSSRRINFCAVKPDMLTGESRFFWFNLARAFFVVVILLFTFLSFRVIVLNRKLSLKITAQMLLLFTVSNLLPGYVMLVICSDFLQQLRKSLIVESFNQSNYYLQKIDELFVNELTEQKRNMNKARPELVANLRQASINRESIRGFADQQFPEPQDIFLVASASSFVAGNRGIVEAGKVTEAFFPDFHEDTAKINTMNSLQKLGFFILKRLNNEVVTTKLETEIEFIGESLFQKRPFELVKQFNGIHFFANWSLGKRHSPFYVEFFRLFDETLYDYFMVYMWDMYDLEAAFISRQYFNFNRNNSGIKVFAVDERIETSFPSEALQHEKIREMAFKLRDRNFTRPEFINIDSQDYLITGHKCLNMLHMRLLALYPLEKIENAIEQKWKILLKFVLISLLISVFLGFSISGSIIRPLVQLQQGVEALHNRNFTYRLPDLGKDEFGHLAEIFNETLVDLEEMQAAKIVQEKLLQPMDGKLVCSQMQVYGRTQALAGMGGDYFEHIEADGKQAFLLGDVAGRGVATSLILAFVKAAVMQMKDYDPGQFMNELNRMLLESCRAQQAKAFSCQFVVATEDGTISIANAGLPFPLIVDHQSRSAKVVELPALPLGRVKKWRPAVCSVTLEPGSSLICFSSGFLQQWQVEYEAVMELVQNSIADDPEVFCNNCFENLFKTINKKSCSKDVSIIVFTRPAVA